MNIQDLEYITAIAESGSIGKAAEKLHVAQPSLSKCIRKIENEYGIVLFTRVKGVSARITPEGEMFLSMANEILLSHNRFREQLKRYRKTEKDTMTLGMTAQRTADIGDKLLEEFYRDRPGVLLQIEVRDSNGLTQGLQDQTLDLAVLSALEKQKGIHYARLKRSCFGVLLRDNSPAAEKAVCLEDVKYPVLRLEDLQCERFAVNTPGSASRMILDEIIKKNNISLELIDTAINQSRKAMVTSGIASSFVPIWEGRDTVTSGGRTVYMIHPDQNVYYDICLACSQGAQNSRVFQKLYQILKKMI